MEKVAIAVWVAEWAFDEANEDECSRHGVTAEELWQVLEDEPVVFLNKKDRAASHMMVGTTHGGRLLTLPIAATHVPGVWRPITAWDSSAGERTRYVAGRGPSRAG